MVVAEHVRKVVTSTTAVHWPDVAAKRQPLRHLPRGGYRMALIPTAWGLSAAVWIVPPDDAAELASFSQKPQTALLAQVLPPGLSCEALRTAILDRHPACLEVLGDGHGTFHSDVIPKWFPEFVRYLQQYYTTGLRGWTDLEFVGHWTYWRSRLHWSSVTPFQRSVLEVVAGIPSGEKRTYGEIARSLGKPAASRAVGAALGANPWPVLVPCHRVLGAGGRMTGFSAPGGVVTKQRMLEMEACPPHPMAALDRQ